MNIEELLFTVLDEEDEIIEAQSFTASSADNERLSLWQRIKKFFRRGDKSESHAGVE